MKARFTILLLLMSFVVGAQQINTAEYYFDIDPGFGNGSQITLNTASLDSTLALGTGTLSEGLHTLVIRLKNSANNWSTVYNATISVNHGSSGPLTLAVAEYYYDTDPGFGNATQVVLNTASLDADVNFSVPNLPSGSHTFNLRLKNSINDWGTVYQTQILVNNGVAGTPVITSAEYYYDTDPGIGNGTLIMLNSSSIDSTLKFNTSGLTPGRHTIFIRLKNSNNNNSLAYQGDFDVFPGIDSLRKIESLEYFIDKDTGVSHNPVIQLTKTMSLDTTVSIPVPDNGGDSRKLGLRLKNQSGQTGNVVLTDISLCQLYKPRAGFRSVQYANTFTLIDTSEYNPSNKHKWYADGVLFDSSYTCNYTFPPATIGTRTIKEVVGTGCRVDSVEHIIAIAGVEEYSPTFGSYGSDVMIDIYGGAMDSGLVVYLQKGDTIVYPYSKIGIDGKRLITIFDFHSFNLVRQFGGVFQYDNYHLHVIFPNSYHYVSPGVVQLMKRQALNDCDGVAQPTHCHGSSLFHNEEPEPYYQATLTGNRTLRTGVWTNFSLNVTNTGSVVAKSVPIYMLIPASYNVDTTNWYIVNPNPHIRDSISIVVPIDTVIGGQHLQLNLYALIIPILGPGQTFNLPFRVLTSTDGQEKIMYWADKRMFGSPFKAFWGPCAEAVFNLVVGFVPVVGCINSVYDFASGSTAYVSNFNGAHRPSTASMVLGAASTALSCAGGPFTQVGKAAFSMAKEMGEVVKGGEALSLYLADKFAGAASFSNGGEANPCSDKAQQEWDEQDWFARSGFDPNHITGNSQYDTVRHWINNYSSQKYYVSFENKAAATANAQHVMVTDTLNITNFAMSTFKMNYFTIGDSSYLLPPYRYHVTQDVGLKHDTNMKVRFTANFDTLTGILTTDYFSIDTSGHVLPLDSLAGFLPPNTDGEKGTGSFQFEIAATDRATLDTFSNKATIYFDNNPPISTNTWMNTIDTTAPQGRILNAVMLNDSTARLIIQQSDIGSGVHFNVLFAKSMADTVFRNRGIVVGDTVLFKGQFGHTYQLFSKAVDNVGNQQNKDSVADITVSFSGALPLSLISFTGKMAGERTQLDWVTENEMNTSHFDVERSAGGTQFAKLLSVTAKGHTTNRTTYTTFDDHPLSGNNYYRLKQFDNDGKFTYSSIVKIYFGKDGYVVIAPNPARDFVNITGNLKFEHIQLIDVSGKIVREFIRENGPKYSLAGISKGMYFIRLIMGSDVQTHKLMIE